MNEKELLTMVFGIEKFHSYFLRTRVIVHIYHSVLRYLMAKKDVKSRFIRWVLLPQEFSFKVKDRKWTANQVVDHLSRLKDEAMQEFFEKS